MCIRDSDRITGKIDEFSPKSKKVHIDIDPSSINKITKVDLALVGDVKEVLKGITKTLKRTSCINWISNYINPTRFGCLSRR